MTNSAPEETLSMGERAASGGDVATEPTRAELVEVLFRRHYAELLRLAVVMLGSREAAEDAVQDAFVSLHRNWRSMRDPEAAEAYLRSAVLNRCRSSVGSAAEAEAAVRRFAGLDVYARLPEDRSATDRAWRRGVALAEAAPRSPLRAAIADLARSVCRLPVRARP